MVVVVVVVVVVVELGGGIGEGKSWGIFSNDD